MLVIEYNGTMHFFANEQDEDVEMFYVRSWFMTRNKMIIDNDVLLKALANAWVCKKRYGVVYDVVIENELSKCQCEYCV